MAFRSLLLCLIVASLGFAPAPLPRAGRVPGSLSLKQLQGTWSVVRYEHQGSPVKGNLSKVEISDESWTFVTSMGGAQSTTRYTLHVDPTKQPTWFDLSSRGGNLATSIVKGIGKREDDTVTLHFTVGNSSGRPSEFSPIAAGTYLLVLKRQSN